jgi:hypothetical protein
VLYCCALDAAAGIRPVLGFICLNDEDYKRLNGFADYMVSISGEGAFKGEYNPDSAQDQLTCAPDLSPISEQEAVLCAT